MSNPRFETKELIEHVIRSVIIWSFNPRMALGRFPPWMPTRYRPIDQLARHAQEFNTL